VNVPDYQLPRRAIAQEPVEPRHAARLLVAVAAEVEHRTVRDLPDFVGEGDLLVVNTTRVMPARLLLTKASGGAAEVLLLAPRPGGDLTSRSWSALVRPGRRLPPGTTLLAGGRAVVEVGEDLGDGVRAVRLLVGDGGDPAVGGDGGDPAVADLLAAIGTVPLPPYIRRPLVDPGRYQTVYADRAASVAAPTAGLHLTDEVLEACRAKGCGVATVDLEVGLATFRPLATEEVEDHVMHAERYHVPAETWAACQHARRVVAVGTTTVRALETAAVTGQLSGVTSLYIRGDYRFVVVDRLMTNFHQPRSSLLVLLEAFCGPRWQELYRVALADGYRFLSLGDAMLVGPSPNL
jgi:S-adenosylmethionine:tRNA ribosyltransferase-isomerase